MLVLGCFGVGVCERRKGGNEKVGGGVCAADGDAIIGRGRVLLQRGPLMVLFLVASSFDYTIIIGVRVGGCTKTNTRKRGKKTTTTTDSVSEDSRKRKREKKEACHKMEQPRALFGGVMRCRC